MIRTISVTLKGPDSTTKAWQDYLLAELEYRLDNDDPENIDRYSTVEYVLRRG